MQFLGSCLSIYFASVRVGFGPARDRASIADSLWAVFQHWCIGREDRVISLVDVSGLSSLTCQHIELDSTCN